VSGWQTSASGNENLDIPQIFSAYGSFGMKELDKQNPHVKSGHNWMQRGDNDNIINQYDN